ncbi:transcriptional regulator [Candidatus Nitrosotalea okcheonensis]|uniref:Transcriptional regulator n=1 Tax=Candidatus Nitrosotalea okcheonensis TaxID=1903276 RepID=A0A2H1FFR2_9ARCH|nr:transcriptional regulator [Candidatus Nitrosotalea okcheonensis]SMH71615.1 Transcriptional regulator [Candidatus Nitrosotalea okcheonensis]
MAKKEKKLIKKSEDKKEVAKAEKKKELPKADKKAESDKLEKKKSKVDKKKETELSEEELEAIDEKEIENFQIEGLDMDKLKTTVLGLVAKRGDNGMFQSELWKKLKLSSRDGSRLALKLERQHLVKREKILENGRWTYKLMIAHVPVTTQSIESAPCLICPVESKCTLEGEISPRTCPLIEQWVLTDLSTKKAKK